jgi:hypothetical protein
MKFCGQVGEVGSLKAAFALRATARPQYEGRATAKRRRGEGGRDHLIVAHHEVVGRVFFQKATRPGRRDDRLAAWAREAVCEAQDRGFDRPSGTELCLTPFPFREFAPPGIAAKLVLEAEVPNVKCQLLTFRASTCFNSSSPMFSDTVRRPFSNPGPLPE